MSVEIKDVVRRVKMWLGRTYAVPVCARKDIFRLCAAAEERTYGKESECCDKEKVAEKPRKRFEYKSILGEWNGDEDGEEVLLNKYGAQGWEVITITPLEHDGEGENDVTILMKREVL